MHTITIYSPQTSNRLLYVLDWLFRGVLQTDYRLVNNEEEVASLPFFISYGKHFGQACSIPDAGILWSREIAPHKIKTGTWMGIPTLYDGNTDHTIPFDLFGALFFLLSRYEEYFDHTPDKHGRYQARDSILFKNGWLERPLLDEWILGFHTLLKEKPGVAITLSRFQFLPSYDIDIAFSYKYKGWKRTLGGLARDLVKGNFQKVKTRLLVLTGAEIDPYDSFGWLRHQHSLLNIHPLYFVLASMKTTAFDKNNHPGHEQMKGLICSFGNEGAIGLHPSYDSYREEVFGKEKDFLEKTIGGSITKSRQHYIRLKIPDTYRQLLQYGILHDYSMGYGSKFGFRAGTGRSFNWYDLKKEIETRLIIHPFCFMDSTARFEEKLDTENAFERLDKMKEILERTGSTLITVFHNFSLGKDPGWVGWSEGYKAFLEKAGKI
jgi:hypothetical protein